MQNYGEHYVADRALTASPLELIRMLYEGAISSIDLARQKLRSGEILERGQAVTKSVEIIRELQIALRSGPQSEMATNLSELYGYMQHRLLEAHVQKSDDALAEVLRLTQCLYDGWLGVMRQLSVASANQLAHDDSEQQPFAAVNPYAAPVMESARRSWAV